MSPFRAMNRYIEVSKSPWPITRTVFGSEHLPVGSFNIWDGENMELKWVSCVSGKDPSVSGSRLEPTCQIAREWT